MKRLLLLGMLVVTEAKAADLTAVRQADKVALSLTGRPLSLELKDKFIKGELTMEQLADKLSSSPEFIDHFAHFWVKLLGMQSPIDVYEFRSRNGTFYRDFFSYSFWHIGAEEASGMDENRLKDLVKEMSGRPVELKIRECNDAPLIYMNNSDNFSKGLKSAAIDGTGFDGKPIVANTKPYWQQLLDIALETSPNCDDAGGSVLVKPYWDPDKVTIKSRYKNVTSYRVVPKVLERCGPALINCSLRNAEEYDNIMDEVNQDISMEPAYLISQTVAEDRPFSDVLTTNQTVMTGSFGYFMGGRGSKLWDNFPGGTIPDIKHAILSPGNRTDRKRYWINRGVQHAGVLTTPAFQIVTNGRRAKANRAYETFLCKKFSVPEGAKADPSDSNPDLTKRAYCSYCHKSLEPMAAFFNRWPLTGVNNYVYDNKDDVDDTGRFNGSTGKGATSFGKIMVESDGFDECSIRRAFEFLNGRKMTLVEQENKMPGFLGEFRGAQKSLRTIIRQMVTAPEFLSGKKAK